MLIAIADPSYRTDYLAAVDALGTGKADAIVDRLGRRADEARPVWLPHLDQDVVLLAPALKEF
jgi:hypothetical protein